MKKQPKKNIIKIELGKRPLVELVDELNKNPETYAEVRNVRLTGQITVNEAYELVYGMTMKDYEQLKRLADKNKFTPEEKKQHEVEHYLFCGATYLYPERMESWRKLVFERAARLPDNLDTVLDTATLLLALLDEGKSIEEVQTTLTNSQLSDKNVIRIRRIILLYSKRGPEFYKGTSTEKLTEEEEQLVATVERENLEYAEIHKNDPKSPVVTREQAYGDR